MVHNIQNAISDVEVLIGGNHFLITANFLGTTNDWHTVSFKNNEGCYLEVEILINEDQESVVMCVLEDRGFTKDQINLIMNTLEDQFQF